MANTSNTSMNISLPATMKKYVESAAKARDYSTPSEYVRELIRQDKQRQQDALEARLLRAINGPFHELSDADLKSGNLVRRLRSKIEKNQYVKRGRVAAKV